MIKVIRTVLYIHASSDLPQNRGGGVIVQLLEAARAVASVADIRRTHEVGLTVLDICLRSQRIRVKVGATNLC